MPGPLDMVASNARVATAAAGVSQTASNMVHIALAAWDRNREGAEALERDADTGYRAFADFLQADAADEIEDGDHEARRDAADAALLDAMRLTSRAGDYRRAERRAAVAAETAMEDARRYGAEARQAYADAVVLLGDA